MADDVTGWQPIETAPRDGRPVLLWSGGFVIGFHVDAGEFKTRFVGWTTGWETSGQHDIGYARIGSPSHWQPLPDPPQNIP